MTTPPATGPAAVLAVAVREVSAVVWDQVDPADAAQALVVLEELQQQVDAARLRVVSRLDAGRLARSGWASIEDFVTHVGGGRRGYGRQVTRLAQRLDLLPATRAAHQAGTVSTAKATVIAEQVAKLPRVHEFRCKVETELATRAAAGVCPEDLADQLWSVVKDLDPDGDQLTAEKQRTREERGAHLSRYLSFSRDRWGGVRIKGYATAEDVEQVKATLMPLTAPHPAEPCACRSTPRRGLLEPSTCSSPQCSGDGRDPRDHGVRLWDALVEACTRIQTLDLAPATHQARPRLTIFVDHADLADGLGGRLPDQTTLSGNAVRRLACDAHIIPVVLGSHSEILDVGREHRLVTPGLWNALVARDHHCAFPGCRRLPMACHAHHIQHWADGGPTSLDNLVLVCGQHHRITHNTAWTIQLDADTRRPTWHPPPPQPLEITAQRISWSLPSGDRNTSPAAQAMKRTA